VIGTFDATTQIDAARDAQAKYDDLGHQVSRSARKIARTPRSGRWT